MLLPPHLRSSFFACCIAALPSVALGATGTLPDGRIVSPAGFTVPVGSFASSALLSPDGKWLAVLAQDSGALEIIDSRESVLVDRLPVASATGMAWTRDGLYVTRGYTGRIARFRYDSAASSGRAVFTQRADIVLPIGLLSGVAEDPATHRIAVARTADRQVLVLDERDERVVATLPDTGQPFSVAFANGTLFATLYDSAHVDAWPGATGAARRIATGPHPTAVLSDGARVFVANADGHDVVTIDVRSLAVERRYDLSVAPNAPPGQTPSGMALSDDGTTLFVTESGYNDVAVVDLTTGKVRGRIPTGWYPMAVAFADRSTVGKKDPRKRPQLWIASAQGLGAQPDPGGEWNGTYTGLVQHLVVEPTRLAVWSAAVAQNDGFTTTPAAADVPPIEHVVFIVRENKQFDEEFGDEPQADVDPELLVYGRPYTPNAHALAERYTLFDNFMGDGEASIYGHAWTTQGMANDYHERNAHSRSDATTGIDARVAWSIWPDPVAGDDTLSPSVMNADWFHDRADLPGGPRVNASGVFGPRGELIDELQRHNVSYRVYGEQMTVAPSGAIAAGLAAHAATTYPGAHIDFNVLDTTRAQIFTRDLAQHGLAHYTYLTLPTDHTAGTRPGFYTPASYVTNNDLALGQIVAAISQRPEWQSTMIFVTTDDPQGTGDHVDAHRQPAFAIGPYVRRGYVDHTRYSIPAVLRTVEALFGLGPLNIYDARATPMFDAFARQPAGEPYTPLPSQFPLQKNPGVNDGSTSLELDGPDAAAIAAQEWSSVRGGAPPETVGAAFDLPWLRLEYAAAF